MKNPIVTLVVSAGIFFGAFAHAAMVIPEPPPVTARAYVLQDFHSGTVIAEVNADAPLEPASVTKIMSAYVIFDAIRQGRLSLEDTVKISEKAWRNRDIPGWTNGSRMFAEVGSLVKVVDLLHGLVVQSGNDATIALAEHVAGSEQDFVRLMNEHAQRLGLSGTLFQNSTGWPMEEHYTTARDMAALSRALIRDFPDFYPLFAEKNFTYNNISQSNRNNLLWRDSSVDGIKTGYTESAGYCIAASAERNGMRLILVVMGSDNTADRTRNSTDLLNYGFGFYETHKLFGAGAVLHQARIWKGERSTLQLGLVQDLYVTIPRGEYAGLKSSMTLKKSIFAPVGRQQELGRIDISLDDEIILQQPLLALKEVDRGNLVQRMIDHVLYLLK